MTDYPYMNSTRKVEDFFNKIQKMGIPDTITTKWLPSIGFKSTNDRPIVKIVKFIGFANSSGQPTTRWQSYRDQNQSKRIMAQGILEGYSELFEQYPDAYQRNDEDLKNYFRANSTAGEQVITYTLGTFKILCSLADFSQNGSKSEEEPQNFLDAENQSNMPLPSSVASHQSGKPSLHIDVQIHIDSDATPEQIDQIFKSMAKHLYDKDTD